MFHRPPQQEDQAVREEVTVQTLSGDHWKILIGDVRSSLKSMPDQHFHTVVTSPPYFGLRDYKCEGQIGIEESPAEFVSALVDVFAEVWRVLRDDGTLWLNLGDSYNAYNGGAGPSSSLSRGAQTQERPKLASGYGLRTKTLKPKDRLGIPHRVVFALQDAGWFWRDEIVWAKRSPMPESVRDRTTKAHEWIFVLSKNEEAFDDPSHELVFLLTKKERYSYDNEAIKEAAVGGTPGNKTHKGATAYANGDAHHRTTVGLVNMGAVETRNLRSVWTLSTEPSTVNHFAPFPSKIPERAIKAGTSEYGCCSECGASYKRLTESSAVTRERPNDLTKRTGEDGTGNHCGNTVAGVSVRTLGWQPGCECGGYVVPCRVLDPFSGTGTSGMIATELGREYVGCELNPQYAQDSASRIESWKFRDLRKPVQPVAGQKDLF